MMNNRLDDVPLDPYGPIGVNPARATLPEPLAAPGSRKAGLIRLPVPLWQPPSPQPPFFTTTPIARG
jgi:hypothetical protein